MNTTQIALVVAAITAGAGIVQATVQGWLVSRSNRITARQEAIKAEIGLLQTLQDQLSAMGQAANRYTLGMFENDFFSNAQWANLRQPLLDHLLSTNGAVTCTAHTLAVDSPAREISLRAADVVAQLGIMNGRQDEASRRNIEWSRNNHFIRDALEVAGSERRLLHDSLQAVTRNAFSRATKRLIHNRTQRIT